ncbi:MAG: TRAP transporter small permease subunit [Sphingomonadaceae bacterium]
MGAWLDRALRVAHTIDRATDVVGRLARWAVLLDVLVASGNALSRKFLDLASNFALDLQLHFLAVLVLLMAGYTLKRNEHVRIDILSARFGARYAARLDALGCLLVIVPLSLAMVVFTWPLFWHALLHHEVSAEMEGGVPRWVLTGLLPLGFALLALQALAEAIKRIAFLRGRADYAPRAGQLIDGPHGR